MNHPRMRSITFGLLLALTVAVAGVTLGERERFWESTDVTLVEIPVQVVRSGAPVTGLTADDFELFDGKKRQKIIGFEEVDLRQIGVAPTTPDAPPAPIDVPAMARRHFLFLFDLSFSEPASLINARDAALDLLSDGLHPTDVAAVGVYSASRGARLLLGFTSDRRQIRLAIDTLGAPELVDRSPDSLGIVFGEARADLEAEMAVSGPDSRRAGFAAFYIDHAQSLALAEQTAQETNQRQRVTAMTRSFDDMATLLARVQGRKQVLYFSEGFRSDLMLGRGQNTDTAEAAQRGDIWNVDGDQIFGNTGLQSDMEAMLESLRRADAVIQAIDIGGTRAINTIQTRADVGGLRLEGDPFADRSTGQDGLFFMANETGGELFRNFNDLGAAMGKVLERTSVTYLLAFQPKDLLPDGSYRKVRVKLRSGLKGAKVVHRPGYYAPKLWSQKTQLEKRLTNADLVLGRRQAGSIELAVTAVALGPSTDDGDKAALPYVVEIDGESLLRSHRGDLLNGEIHVYAIDEHGTVHAFHNQLLGMNLQKTRVELERTGLKFCGQLTVPPGRYDLRALVRNNGAQTYGLETRTVAVPDFAAGHTIVAPLFVEPAADWVMVSANATGQAASYPWATEDQVWVPKATARLDADRASTVWLAATGAVPAAIEAQVRHDDDASPAHAVTLAVAHRTVGDDGEQVLLSFTPPQLPPGAYVLEWPAGGTGGNARLPFSIDG